MIDGKRISNDNATRSRMARSNSSENSSKRPSRPPTDGSRKSIVSRLVEEVGEVEEIEVGMMLGEISKETA